MTALSSPPPPEDNPSHHRDPRRQRRPRTPQILSREQCLQGLSQLPAMLALDYFKPQKVNAMRAVYSDLLRHHAAQAQAPAGTLPTAEIMALARQSPVVFNALQAMMTDEQFQAVMDQIREDDDPADNADYGADDNADDGADDDADYNANDGTDDGADDDARDQADTGPH